MNRILSIAGLAVAAAMLGSLAGCHSSSSAESQQAASSTAAAAAAVRVTAARPVRKTLRLESVQPGQIEAFEQTPLFAKLPAYVEKLHVDIGDRVEADQLLVDLFLPELKDELRQKEAAVVQAQAEIELAAAAVRAAEAAVATAQANISLAEAGNIRAEADCRALAIAVRADQPTGGRRLARPQTRRRDARLAQGRGGGAWRGPREGGSGQGDASCKARPMWRRPRPTKPWPAPATETPRPILRASKALLAVHANPRPVCRRRDRAERESRRFRPAGQHHDRQAALGRRPHRYGPHLRRRPRNGLAVGRGGPDRVRQRAGPSRPDRGRESDADQLGLGRQSDLAHGTGPSQSRTACCGRACTPPRTSFSRSAPTFWSCPWPPLSRRGNKALCWTVQDGRTVREADRPGAPNGQRSRGPLRPGRGRSGGSVPGGVACAKASPWRSRQRGDPMATLLELAKGQARCWPCCVAALLAMGITAALRPARNRHASR